MVVVVECGGSSSRGCGSSGSGRGSMVVVIVQEGGTRTKGVLAVVLAQQR